jgi:hypothetical protein
MALAAPAIRADTDSVTVRTEATIRSGTYASANVDEVADGRVMVKYAGLPSDLARKGYFEFDLTGRNTDTSSFATFNIALGTASGRTCVQIWALNQPYSGMSADLTWNTAQANDTLSNALLTDPVNPYTAALLGEALVKGVTIAGEVVPLMIPIGWGGVATEGRLVLVLTSPDHPTNNSSGLRIRSSIVYPESAATLTFNTTTGNRAPSVSAITDLSLYAGQPGTATFTVSDDTTQAADLTVTATSSDETLVPSAFFTFTGEGVSGQRSLGLTAATSTRGIATITVSVTDGDGLENRRCFKVNILPTPAVAIAPSANTTVSTPVTVPFTVISATTPPASVGVTNQQVTFVGPAGSSYQSVVAPLAGGPYAAGGGWVFTTRVRASWITLPRDSTGPFIHLYDSATAAILAKVHTVTNGVTEGFFRLGIASGAGNAYVDFPRDLAINAPFNLVTRYAMDTGTSTLWINPASESDTHVTATDVPVPAVTAVGIRNRDGMGALVLDDLQVEAVVVLPHPPPNLTSIRVAAGTVQIDFTAGPNDTPANLKVLGAATVDGTFTDTTALITASAPGVFRASTPQSGDLAFYRIVRIP